MTQLIKAPNLSVQDEQALLDLYTRGTPENTLRAYERDLIYIEAWKGAPLVWPVDLSRNCAAPLTAYYTQKENDYGNETHSRV